MEEETRAYFRDRAEAELEAGESARHPNAARAHYLLAAFYFDRSFNVGAKAEEIRDAAG